MRTCELKARFAAPNSGLLIPSVRLAAFRFAMRWPHIGSHHGLDLLLLFRRFEFVVVPSVDRATEVRVSCSGCIDDRVKFGLIGWCVCRERKGAEAVLDGL